MRDSFGLSLTLVLRAFDGIVGCLPTGNFTLAWTLRFGLSFTLILRTFDGVVGRHPTWTNAAVADAAFSQGSGKGSWKLNN